ncbi:MAG TPA: hypothetical protein VK469_13530 [Candidatus Kapabacteria bacterium]|nr:hypothetical protein [Candidatus Kapabacteria bacterium]
MEPGINNSCACLLPTGSATESIEGISHLLEHFLIFELIQHYAGVNLDGHTTEDYVILFYRNLTLENIIETLRSMDFDNVRLNTHKERLKKEINVNLTNREEFFFRFVWEGTIYEKSPLGLPERVDMISSEIMDAFRCWLLKEYIFGYTQAGGLKISNPSTDIPFQRQPLPQVPIQFVKKNKHFQDRWYDIYYFNRDSEAFYLLERMLKLLNPQKHIQLSEKKKMSALILEKGICFPTRDQVKTLKKKALAKIIAEISEIESNFEELALNQLESMFFRGYSWPERIEFLLQTTENHLSELLSIIVVGDKANK